MSFNAIGRNLKYGFKLWVWTGKLFSISLWALASQMVAASVPACVNGKPQHRPESCMTYDRTEGVAGTLNTWCDKNQS